MVNLSSPTELQQAIDGNRREGRRTGYDSYPHLFPPMLGSPVNQLSAGALAAAAAAGIGARPPLPPVPPHTQGMPMPPSSMAFSLPPMSPLPPPPPPPPSSAAALRPNMFNGSSGGFPGSK